MAGTAQRPGPHGGETKRHGSPHPADARRREEAAVADARSARDSRAIDTIGHYNPRTDPIELKVDEDKAKDWLSKGAQPSDTVARLFKQIGILPTGK